MTGSLPSSEAAHPPANEPGPWRRPALDGIRALAFAGVLLAHVRVPYLSGGGVGVDVFFVLSGFLITGILLKERERTGSLDLRRFYLRRAARLLPALFVLVVATSAYALLVQRYKAPSVGHLLSTDFLVLFYVGNWVRALHNPDALLNLEHTWSLSIEEQFYLIWPLCMIFVLKWRGLRALLVAALLGSAISLGLRIGLIWIGGASFDRIYNGTDTRADLLLIGCALAAALSLWPEVVRRVCRVAWLPGAVILLAAASTDITANWRQSVGYTLIALASAVVIGYVWCEPASFLARILSVRALAATGLISYGLYLWHFPILLAVEGHVHGVVMRGIATTIPTFAAAYLSWRFVERPIQHLVRTRRRDVPRVEGSLTPIAPSAG